MRLNWFMVWIWRYQWVLVAQNLGVLWSYEDDLDASIIIYLVNLAVAVGALRFLGKRIPEEVPADDRIKS